MDRGKIGFRIPTKPVATEVDEGPHSTDAGEHPTKPNPDPRIASYIAMVVQQDFDINVSPRQVVIHGPNGAIILSIVEGETLQMVYDPPWYGEPGIALYEGGADEMVPVRTVAVSSFANAVMEEE